MQPPFSLYLALKYLRPKRSFISVVTVISVLGVLLGVAILIIVLSVMSGFDSMWRDKILSFKPHLTVSARVGVIDDEEDVCRRIEALPGFKGAAPSIQTLVLMQYDGRIVAPLVLGIDPARARRVSHIAENTHIGKFDLGDDKVVVGVDLASALGLGIGDKVLVYSSRNVMSGDEVHLPEELNVSGIFDLGMRDYDARFILTSLDVARDLTGMSQGAETIHVMTDDPFRFLENAVTLRKALGPQYVVRTWQEEDSLLFAALRNEKALMFILLVFITIVAVFCIANTLIVVTVQKTNEIGLLKALGFSSRRIMGVFVWHGWIQGLMGTMLGIALGILVVRNLNPIVKWLTHFNINLFPKGIYGISDLPTQIERRDVCMVAVVVMTLSTLASVLASWRAARLHPVEALRHE